MKIGIFTDAYHPSISGVVTSIKMLEKELIKRGHEVHVFAPTTNEVADNQNLYLLKSIPLLVAKKYKYRIATFYSRSKAKIIKDLNLDILHTQSEFSLGLFGKIISRKFNIPYVHTYHTMWEDYVHYINPLHSRKLYTKKFARIISRNFVNKASYVIAPSNKTAKYLKYRCKIQKPIAVIPTGIEIKPFDKNNFSDVEKNNLKISLGIKKDEKVVLFLGRIGEEKSLDVVLKNMTEVFKKYKNCKLLIVGDGPSKKNIEDLAKNLNIDDKTIFTGFIDWNLVPKYYSIADIFVNASKTETQGLTFIEAMAASVPIIARYAPNLAEYIHSNENGILIKKDEELAASILNILTNETLKDNLIKNGISTAEKFSSKVFADNILKLYEEVISKHNQKEVNK